MVKAEALLLRVQQLARDICFSQRAEVKGAGVLSNLFDCSSLAETRTMTKCTESPHTLTRQKALAIQWFCCYSTTKMY